MEIIYHVNTALSVDAFADLLCRSSLAERRPMDDRECLEGMLANSNLLVTAWIGNLVVGVARSVTDFYYCCYLSDLAVDRAYQGQGIGRELQRLTYEQLGPHCKIILLAAPAAVSYYPHLGYQRHDECWVLPRTKPIL